MRRPKIPLVFRIAAGLLVAAAAIGSWWQHQPAGETGRAFLAGVAQACPTAAHKLGQPTVADTARALDRWAYARARDLLLRDGRNSCSAEPR